MNVQRPFSDQRYNTPVRKKLATGRRTPCLRTVSQGDWGPGHLYRRRDGMALRGSARTGLLTPAGFLRALRSCPLEGALRFTPRLPACLGQTSGAAGGPSMRSAFPRSFCPLDGRGTHVLCAQVSWQGPRAGRKRAAVFLWRGRMRFYGGALPASSLCSSDS